ncbi:Transcription factor aptf-2 [Caenorhabditis elegans]|nr:Transcription factor aptf-2 [Caenorhabditis elegans]CAB60610.1 Transcription factor aptf-2 [Caenorhabditis elegans]|eukprot:NP_001255741.1 AP-2 Transcription Factor family [Caenorhabditis elegans]
MFTTLNSTVPTEPVVGPVEPTVPTVPATKETGPSSSAECSTQPAVAEQEDNSLLAQLLKGKITSDDAKLQPPRGPFEYAPMLSEEAQFAIKLAGLLNPNPVTEQDPSTFKPPPKMSNNVRKNINLTPVIENAVPSGFELESPKDQAFDVVHGRLSMGQNQTCYFVTVEEMRRRLQSPEKLNSSSIACNLKRPKLKNGGELMRAQLRDHGIKVQLNAKQKAFPNKVIALVEAEAVHLGLDLGTAVRDDYPVQDIIQEVAHEALADEDADLDALMNDKDFTECMSALESVFTSVVPPITGIEPKPSNNMRLNNGMETFSSASHGLGIVSQRVWLPQLTAIGNGVASELRRLTETPTESKPEELKA